MFGVLVLLQGCMQEEMQSALISGNMSVSHIKFNETSKSKGGDLIFAD